MSREDKDGKALGIQGLLGVGFDAEDGHTRISRGPNFYLVGGSEETHARMQETAVRFNERVEDLGKSLPEINREDLRDIVNDLKEG